MNSTPYLCYYGDGHECHLVYTILVLLGKRIICISPSELDIIGKSFNFWKFWDFENPNWSNSKTDKYLVYSNMFDLKVNIFANDKIVQNLFTFCVVNMTSSETRSCYYYSYYNSTLSVKNLRASCSKEIH